MKGKKGKGESGGREGENEGRKGEKREGERRGMRCIMCVAAFDFLPGIGNELCSSLTTFDLDTAALKA